MVGISSEFKNKSVVNPDAPDYARDAARCQDPMMRACNNGYSYAAGDLRVDRMDARPGAGNGEDVVKELSQIETMWEAEIKDIENALKNLPDERYDLKPDIKQYAFPMFVHHGNPMMYEEKSSKTAVHAQAGENRDMKRVTEEKRRRLQDAVYRAKNGIVGHKHEKLKASMVREGFLDAGTSVLPKPGCYRVAIVYFADAPEGQLPYRFIREDSDGGWSHMNASGDVKRTDRYGMPVSVPHVADWGENASFVGYMYAPKGGVRVAGKPVGLVVAPGNTPHLKK